MSFYGSYQAGDTVPQSARRETDISRVLSAFSTTGEIIQRGNGANYCRIPVTCSDVALAALTPVQLTGTYVALGQDQSPNAFIFVVKKATDASKPFGILLSAVEPNQIGAAVFLGIVPATVTRKSDKHNYAVLNQSGQLESAAAGPAAILWINGTDALICLGVGAGAAVAAYDGPFAVTAVDGKLSVSKGWVLRNGETAEVPVTSVDAATGILCVCTTLKDGKWTAPEYKFCDPAPDAYPVAEIKTIPPVAPETTAKITIRQFPVTVAVINLVKPCPLAEV